MSEVRSVLEALHRGKDNDFQEAIVIQSATQSS